MFVVWIATTHFSQGEVWKSSPPIFHQFNIHVIAKQPFVVLASAQSDAPSSLDPQQTGNTALIW